MNKPTKKEELNLELTDLKIDRDKGLSLFIVWIILDVAIKSFAISENKPFDISFLFLILSTTFISLSLAHFIRKDTLRIKEIKKELSNPPEFE